jgi:hypothetical protein
MSFLGTGSRREYLLIEAKQKQKQKKKKQKTPKNPR